MWRFASFFIGAVFAGLIFFLAVPRLMASLELLYVHGLDTHLEESEKLNAAELHRLREGYIASLGYLEQSSVYFSKATSEIELARREPEKYQEWVEEAVASLKNSLRLGPSNPEGWLWLAQLDKLFPEDRDDVSDAFALALLLGPYEKMLVPQYLRYGFEDWDKMTPDQQNQLTDLVIWLERVNRPVLANLAKENSAYFVKIVNILVSDEVALARFIKFIGL